MEKFVVFCSGSTNLDAIKYVVDQGFKIDILIGLDHKKFEYDKVSGLTDLSNFAAKINSQFYAAESYDLSKSCDKDFLLSQNIRLIWVAGWQRLIPEWLLSHSKGGAIGGHGSPDGINKGRGRSPQNWALIMGCSNFKIALFELSAGIDDGPVIYEKEFNYTIFDDIKTSYKKVSLCMGSMVAEYLSSIIHQPISLNKDGSSMYYPQRIASDGNIDWNAKVNDIYNFVRALTHPYPLARSVINKNEVKLEAATPFDDYKGEPGLISFVFEDSSFLVNARDGRLIVNKYCTESDWVPVANEKFEIVNTSDNIMEIIQRHKFKLPNYRITERILNFYQVKE